jgi:thiamine pyrophosphate-dependent acetolactate synthase large subunit-like protein
MAHGYAKIEGRPMMVLIQGAGGLKQAAMAIYNAYADRVPICLVALASRAASRAAGVPDIASSVREFVKWDHAPRAITSFARVVSRACAIALTPPMAPVLLVIDESVVATPFGRVNPPVLQSLMARRPQGGSEAVREAARLLVGAQRPLILAERAARTAEGLESMVQLAELLQSPVRSWERVNFPNRHPLAGSGGARYRADVVLALEVDEISPAVRRTLARGAKLINISSRSLDPTLNFQADGRYAGDVEIDMAADAQATLPGLIDECRRLMTDGRRRTIERRGTQIAAAHRRRLQAQVDQRLRGWNAGPVSPSRLCGELWELIKEEDWSLVSWDAFIGRWPTRHWNLDKHHRYIGGQGAAGLGYGAPAAIGAALANRKHGRLSINIQTDGDLMYGPGVLWTASHHRIPLLTLMHNNRRYQEEFDPLRRHAVRCGRDPDCPAIGLTIDEPCIDYAEMARSLGLYAEGPIADPGELSEALRRGIARVKQGEPVLIDVLTQPR